MRPPRPRGGAQHVSITIRDSDLNIWIQTINSRVPYSASKFAIRGMMESLYVELRQNYPGNSLHLMLVSPFIVETG